MMLRATFRQCEKTTGMRSLLVFLRPTSFHYKYTSAIPCKCNDGPLAIKKNLAPVHFAQTLTYQKLSDKKLALLINFNPKLLKDGIHRIVNNL